MKCLLLLRLTSAIFTIILAIDPTSGQVLKGNRLSAANAVLSIRAKESSVKSGAPIWVDVTLKNKSDQDLLVFRVLTSADDDPGMYNADVQNEKGQKPPPIKFKIGIGSGASLPLQPGKTITDRINICKLYDVSQPGKYSIQVYRPDGSLRSNTITVTVTP